MAVGVFSVLAGCGASGEGGGDEGPSGQSCAEPDRTCPGQGGPVLGSPCEGALHCEWIDDDGYGWQSDCAQGAWASGGGCRIDEEGDESCRAPVLSERCSEPFEGTLDGAIVRFGPGDPSTPFRTFADGDQPAIVYGGQGSAMFPARLEVVGVEVPGCLAVRTLVATEDEPIETWTPLAMHCDRSNPFYLVLPGNCSGEPVTAHVEVEAQGVGTTEVDLELPPGGCGDG